MEIDKELYKQIKEYCDLNGIKAKDYVHNLLLKAFMEDKYGDAPFVAYKEKNRDTSFNSIHETVAETKVREIVDDMKSGDDEFSKVVENVGGAEKYNDLVTDLVFDDKKNTKRDSFSLYLPEHVDGNPCDYDKEEKKPKKRKIETK